MTRNWKKRKLTEFIWFQRGYDLPKRQFKEGDVPVYGATSILGYHNEYRVQGPGIITGRSGTLGKFQYCNGNYWPHNTSLWVRDFKGNDPKFAYYLLHCLDFSLFNSGGAVPTLNRNVLNAYLVDVPPLPTQRKIASILSAYDDLIENNLKRIKLLEEKAQLTYEEWFVRMKFPGHESTPINEGTGLPEGWATEYLEKVSEINSENVDKNYRGEILYIDIKGVSTNSIDSKTKIDIQDAPSRAKRKVKHGDIIWSSVRPNLKSHAVIWKPQVNWIASTGFCVISPKGLPTSYLYQFLTADSFVGYLTNLAGGAAYPAVKAEHFKAAEVIVPPKELLNQYDSQFQHSLELIWNLKQQNQMLKEARDILLPPPDDRDN